MSTSAKEQVQRVFPEASVKSVSASLYKVFERR